MTERQKDRRTITLDAEVAAMVSALADRVEHTTGFRPTSAQIVRGLIVRALASQARP